jgi:hypothetical protein
LQVYLKDSNDENETYWKVDEQFASIARIFTRIEDCLDIRPFIFPILNESEIMCDELVMLIYRAMPK